MAQPEALALLRQLQSDPSNKVSVQYGYCSSAIACVMRSQARAYSCLPMFCISSSQVCVDCPQKNPQWASVTYGTFMCLECSGKYQIPVDLHSGNQWAARDRN